MSADAMKDKLQHIYKTIRHKFNTIFQSIEEIRKKYTGD